MQTTDSEQHLTPIVDGVHACMCVLLVQGFIISFCELHINEVYHAHNLHVLPSRITSQSRSE